LKFSTEATLSDDDERRYQPMSVNMMITWLDDSTLSRLASRGIADPSIWAERYDPTCPSEFYRGYATLLGRIGEALRSNANAVALSHLIDEFDMAIKALPANERRDGAAFALMNVASYARAGTIPQISATLGVELTCIAHCFVHNQTRGL
jgi:hypothetical protein